LTTPKTTDNKSAAGNSAQAKTQAVALGASEHSGKLFKSKVGANGFEPSTSCSQVLLKPWLGKAFNELWSARPRKTPRKNCDSAPWAHPKCSAKIQFRARNLI